jgi:GGDEF domain-containing protein
VALEIAPGLKAGTLCVVDTMPRDFGAEDLEGLRDLAAMAAAELRLSAAADLQQSIVVNKEVTERRAMLDAATGCWNAAGHEALLQRMGQAGAPSEVALLGLRVAQLGTLASAHGPTAELVAAELAQQIRSQLPPQALLTRPADDLFCVMLPCKPGSAGEAAIQALRQQTSFGIHMPTLGQPARIELPVRHAIGWVRALDTRHPASAHWEVVAAHLH